MSLRGLADALGGLVSPQAIGKYERNEMTPSSQVLTALATRLGVTLDFLAAPAGASLGAIDFRKHSGTSAAERAQVEAAVLDHVERYLVVEEALGLESASWMAPFPPSTIARVEQAEDVAERVRDVWGLGGGPLPNMTEVLEAAGMKVMLLPLPARVSGLTCEVARRDGRPVPVVVVNGGPTHPLERRRLTLAHELGHRVVAVEGAADLEKAATRFAGALLMPRHHVEREVGLRRRGLDVDEIMALKRLYRVSAAAFVVRLRDLGIIAQEQLAYVFQTVGRGWRTAEPQPIEGEARHPPLEAPTRYARLCRRASAEGVIGDARMAALLDGDVGGLDVRGMPR